MTAKLLEVGLVQCGRCERHIGRWREVASADRRDIAIGFCTIGHVLVRRRRYTAGGIGIVLGILETGVLALEGEEHIAHGAITMLGNDDFGHAAEVATFVVGIDMVVFGAVDEDDHIGILLDGSRFAEVAQLRALSFVALAVFDTTIQLAQGQNGNV